MGFLNNGFGKFLGRSAAGAAIGAWAGGEGNRGKGAAIGAIAGGPGVWGARRIGRGMGWDLSNRLQALGGLNQRLGTRIATASGRLAGGGARGRMAGIGFNFGAYGAKYAGTANQWIGNNAMSINKYGGAAMATLGVYSAASIGSSVMGSNNGY